MLKKILYYWKLLTTDRPAFRFQLWMVWNRHKINFIQWLFNVYADLSKKFLTIHRRPVSCTTIHTWSDFGIQDHTIAIVLQGPLVHRRNFTLETVLLYKRHYPKSIIILSTWEDELPETLHALRNAGAEVITSKKPTVTGIGNVNLQLTSTLAGIQRAKNMGATFVYKTRCDQRMYAPNMNDALYSLLETFPPRPGYVQKYRIAGSSFGTLKYVPYLLTDVFQFGHIDDMLLYWSAPHDPRTVPSKFINSVQDLIDERMCEVYLCSTYLEKIGRTLSWTIADSWQAFADHFVIVDREALDLFFYKYDFYLEHRTRPYHGIPNDSVLTFGDWITLYANAAAYTPNESWLSRGRKDVLPNPS